MFIDVPFSAEKGKFLVVEFDDMNFPEDDYFSELDSYDSLDEAKEAIGKIEQQDTTWHIVVDDTGHVVYERPFLGMDEDDDGEWDSVDEADIDKWIKGLSKNQG